MYNASLRVNVLTRSLARRVGLFVGSVLGRDLGEKYASFLSLLTQVSEWNFIFSLKRSDLIPCSASHEPKPLLDL